MADKAHLLPDETLDGTCSISPDAMERHNWVKVVLHTQPHAIKGFKGQNLHLKLVPEVNWQSVQPTEQKCNVYCSGHTLSMPLHIAPTRASRYSSRATVCKMHYSSPFERWPGHQ